MWYNYCLEGEFMAKINLTKKDIFTIPNILSFFRILLIPVILWLYCYLKNYNAAVIAVIVSAITDIADGRIARKYNMISDFGNICCSTRNWEISPSCIRYNITVSKQAILNWFCHLLASFLAS